MATTGNRDTWVMVQLNGYNGGRSTGSNRYHLTARDRRTACGKAVRVYGGPSHLPLTAGPPPSDHHEDYCFSCIDLWVGERIAEVRRRTSPAT